jgi:hypothetical protein
MCNNYVKCMNTLNYDVQSNSGPDWSTSLFDVSNSVISPVANLPIFVFSGKCQMSCTVLGCKHNPHLWTSGPHTTLTESVSDRLSRHMHICGLLEVILQGSGSAPPCTKVEVAVLLLGCCPPTVWPPPRLLMS